MLNVLARKWWALAIRGGVTLLFGVLMLLVPGITLTYLVFLFGTYAVMEGIFDIAVSFRSMATHWALFLEGLFSVVAGILAFIWPGITTLVLLYLIAFWAVATGIFEVLTGIRLRKILANEWTFILTGFASLLFGLLILFAPATGALIIVFWVGAYTLLFGGLTLILAFRLRAYNQGLGPLAKGLTSH
jgi:uncharacterized membrane protein HdeD (DUF308 family)